MLDCDWSSDVCSSDLVAAEPATPYANIGFAILKPQVLDGQPDAPFSIIPTWHRLQAEGRLFGAVMDGFWMHVGDPAARDAAEAHIRAQDRVS
jgi:MurNAc alpha-1-phosphate uridylyltransferase